MNECPNTEHDAACSNSLQSIPKASGSVSGSRFYAKTPRNSSKHLSTAVNTPLEYPVLHAIVWHFSAVSLIFASLAIGLIESPLPVDRSRNKRCHLRGDVFRCVFPTVIQIAPVFYCGKQTEKDFKSEGGR